MSDPPVLRQAAPLCAIITMHQDNIIWAKLNGGYKIPYDASIPLNELRLTDDPKLIKEIFVQLWENLHHQGDVGDASYYSVPQLVDICIAKKSFDSNFVGLCVLIENCRLSESNPQLPKELEKNYFGSLKKFEQYLLTNLENISDETTFQLTLALFATINGHRKLGKAIQLLDEGVVEELLARF